MPARCARDCGRGMTLVELIVAMLILSAIAGVGTRSFLMVLRAGREMDEQAAALASEQRITREIRRDLASLVPVKLGGQEPFRQSADPERGTPVYQLLTRVSESFSAEETHGEAQAILVRYALEENPEGGLRLRYSKQAVSQTGLLGEPLKGTLAENLAAFALKPVAEGGAQEETADPDASPPVPKAFRLELKCGQPGQETSSLSLLLPVRCQGKKPSGEGSAAGAQGGGAAADPSAQSASPADGGAQNQNPASDRDGTQNQNQPGSGPSGG